VFKLRRFQVGIILVCLRWSCKYGISYRDLAEVMQESGLSLTSWRADETYAKAHRCAKRLRAKQFARSVVLDRSRILHGTWPTLNSRLAFNRNGLENFVITVIRRAALELEDYAHSPSQYNARCCALRSQCRPA
jgi:transposase-like protein